MANSYEVDLKVGDGKTMSSADFAMLMQYLTTATTGTLYGCKVSKKDSLTVSVANGYVVVCGRIVRVNNGTLSITNASLPTTASKKVTFYVQVKTDILMNKATVILTKSKGTTTDDAKSQTSGVGYHTIATVSVGNKGIESVTVAALMKTTAQAISKSTDENQKTISVTKSQSGSKLASKAILNKVGDVVICHIERSGSVASNKEEMEVLTIPAGWRPKRDTYGFYAGVSGKTIPAANAFGRYKVSASSGKLREITNFAGQVERHATMTWVVD